MSAGPRASGAQVKISRRRLLEIGATAIAVGSDADIVLWDSTATRKVEKTGLLSKAGFSLHEGWEPKGWPKMTIRRGGVVCEDGRVTASPGSGRIPSRGPTQRLSKS